MDRAKFVDLLRALCSPDNASRQKAETAYQQAKSGEPDGLTIGLLAVLGAEDVEESVRRYAAVLLRQMCERGAAKDFVFSRLADPRKLEVATELLRRFEQEAAPKLQRKIGEVISKLAEHVCDKEDPRGSLAPGGPNGWPMLLPLLFRMAAAGSPDAAEAALRVLGDLVATLQEDIVQAQAELSQILQAGLSHQSAKVKTASLLLVCHIVGEAEKKAWAPLLGTTGVLVQVMQQLAQAGEETLLQECIQAFIEVASVEPEFFKSQLSQTFEPATFMATVAKSRDNVSNGIRSLALEWLVSYLEKRTKWLAKNLKQFPPLVLESCLELLLDVGDTEDDLQTWAARMDGEEGDEDEDVLLHAGEEALDRVGEALPIEELGPMLFPLIGLYASQERWQAKHAALTVVRQTVEYIEEGHIDEMAKLLMQHLQHPHPRVRHAALHALGQLANDQSPTFQESWHQSVMPALLNMMDDSVDKVASMALSAFVSFGEDLDTSLMSGYAHGLMEKLVAKLQTSCHRGVQEESITCVAVVAGNIGKDFGRYYDSVMPMLKQLVMTATGEKQNRLRGKAFECMSLLGLAVGKEKFLPDAHQAIDAMLKTPLDADDVQREYIKEASERICQCLKRDFRLFVPALLPGLARTLRFEEVAETAQVPDEDADNYVKVTAKGGKLVQVHTQKFEEMKQSLSLLLTFCTEMEGAYFEFVEETAAVLLPLLSNEDEEFAAYCEQVRGIALQAWGLLIKVARAGEKERNSPPALASSLLSAGLRTTFAILDSHEDAEALAGVASGITQCVKNVGADVLESAEVAGIAEKMFAIIDQSMQRSRKYLAVKQKSGASANLPGDEEEDEEDWQEGEEEQLRRNCEEVLGAVMEVSAEHFQQCLPTCAEKMAAWLQTEQHRVLALYLACDILLHLKERAQSMWCVFMPQVFKSLSAGEKEDPDARTAAAYAVHMAAPFAAFDEAAPEAFRGLAKIVGGPKPKKRDHKGKRAMDNAVAALCILAKEKRGLCPPDIQAWPLAIARMPLRDDEDEARKLHGKIVDLVLAQDEALLGPGRANLGPLLGVFAEIYQQESICDKPTEEKILKIFQMMPKDMLQGLAGKFTEKQMKKIEKMLCG